MKVGAKQWVIIPSEQVHGPLRGSTAPARLRQPTSRKAGLCDVGCPGQKEGRRAVWRGLRLARLLAGVTGASGVAGGDVAAGDGAARPTFVDKASNLLRAGAASWDPLRAEALKPCHRLRPPSGTRVCPTGTRGHSTPPRAA